MGFSSRTFAYDALLCNKKFKVPAGELCQVSQITVIRGGEIEEHIQYCDEITYAISGRAKMHSGDRCEEIREGQIHYIKSGMYHKIIADDDMSFSYICIGFIPDPLNAEIRAFLDLRDDTETFIKNDDGNVRNLVLMFLNEFYIQDEQSGIMTESFFKLILNAVARIYRENRSYKDKKSTSTSNYAVYNAIRYIDANYRTISNVKNVAKALSYSESYLSHIFSEKIGMSVKEYIIKKKLQLAAEMLKTDDISIEKLSEYLNFNSPHTFRQAFKKLYSQSPSEYRKTFSKF
ncbi:MAG: helix-turn-helix domain-containing protein [Eubacteriales bacterium]|nr:helix-turn-helix domain-containing protein [Eubacteriales bacterium]